MEVIGGITNTINSADSENRKGPFDTNNGQLPYPELIAIVGSGKRKSKEK